MNVWFGHGGDAKNGRRVVIDAAVIQSAVRRHPFLRGLVVTAAGYERKATGQGRCQLPGSAAVILYCVGGGGWCELRERLHPVRKGNALVLPPGADCVLGSHASDPWTVHWVQAAGQFTADYLRQMGAAVEQPVLWLGEDLHVVSLFNEALENLGAADALAGAYHAAHTLGHLLSVLVQRRQAVNAQRAGSLQKVAQSIIYMSEHVSQPLRVTALAALANLSPAHFSVLFRRQTGCAPRDYLQLLRMHRACQLLRETGLNVKEVAALVGYQDPLYFSRAFKAFEGMAPLHYRSAGDHP